MGPVITIYNGGVCQGWANVTFVVTYQTLIKIVLVSWVDNDAHG